MVEKDGIPDGIDPNAQRAQDSKPERKTAEKTSETERAANPKHRPDKDSEIDMFSLEKQFPNPSVLFSYVPPRLDEIHKDCIFLLDANALLAPFGINKDAVEDLGAIYKNLTAEKRLFIPERAAREYARHRPTYLSAMHYHLESEFDGKSKETGGWKAPPKINIPMLTGMGEYEAVREANEKVREAASDYRKKLDILRKEASKLNWNDATSKLYAEIFNDAVIIKLEFEEAVVRSDLKWRYANEIPPGYKDKGKPDGGVGDLLIWYSVIQAGKSQNKNVILITDDSKPDWLVQKLFARYELVLEFNRETDRHFGVMPITRFSEIHGAKKETVKQLKMGNQELEIRRPNFQAAPYGFTGPQSSGYVPGFQGGPTGPQGIGYGSTGPQGPGYGPGSQGGPTGPRVMGYGSAGPQGSGYGPGFHEGPTGPQGMGYSSTGSQGSGYDPGFQTSWQYGPPDPQSEESEGEPGEEDK